MAVEITREKAEQIIEVILMLLGSPVSMVQAEALNAFPEEPDRIKFLAMTHPEDHFCRALSYLVSVSKLTPNSFTIASEALRAAGDHVRSQTLLEGGKALAEIFANSGIVPSCREAQGILTGTGNVLRE